MPVRLVWVLSAALLAVSVAMPALAKDCPTSDFSSDAREDAVRKASTCKEALTVAESCAFGSGGDTGLTDVVIEKCEADFLAKLSKAQRQTYNAGMKRCDRKYQRQEGTMYRSMEAFCRANLARDTAAKFAGAPRR